jgi:hypothetical protein
MTDSAVEASGRVGLLFRGDPSAERPLRLEESRLRGVGEAMRAAGLAPEAVVYTEETEDDARRQMHALDAVLVWVDPVSYGRNRNQLDALLADVAASGVWVSSAPALIMRLGTKEMLARTQSLGWGCNTLVYRSYAELVHQLPRALASGESRVLKPNRGNGGIGVRRVELAGGPLEGVPGPDAAVTVQKAGRESIQEEMTLGQFFEVCSEYFDGTYAEPQLVIDQAYQERLGEGMVRCYLVRDEVAGFGHQLVTALLKPQPGERGPPSPPPRQYFPPSKPEFQSLKEMLERDWLPEMLKLLDIDVSELPALWDADFLYGPRTAAGEDTFVLCEVNISAVLPFPDATLEPLAEMVAGVVRARRAAGVARETQS